MFAWRSSEKQIVVKMRLWVRGCHRLASRQLSIFISSHLYSASEVKINSDPRTGNIQKNTNGCQKRQNCTSSENFTKSHLQKSVLRSSDVVGGAWSQVCAFVRRDVSDRQSSRCRNNVACWKHVTIYVCMWSDPLTEVTNRWWGGGGSLWDRGQHLSHVPCRTTASPPWLWRKLATGKFYLAKQIVERFA